MAMWAAQGVLGIWEATWTHGAPPRSASEALPGLILGADWPTSLVQAGELSVEALHKGCLWTLVTHLFLHQGLLHAGGNALVLWLFGRPVEAILGRRMFLALWLAGGLLGALIALAVTPDLPVIGGSAAASAVLFAMVTMLPELDLRSLIPGLGWLPVPVRARHFGWGCLGAWLLAPLFLPGEGGAGHAAALAHAAGSVAGWTGARMLGFGRQRRAMVALPRFAHARVLDAPMPAAVTARPETRAGGPAELPSSDFLREVVDPILEKLARGGWKSLAPRERALLIEASRRLRSRA